MLAVLAVLAVLTLAIVVVYAIASKARTETDLHDVRDAASTLAKDGPNGAVAFLSPDARPDGTPPTMQP